MLVARVEILGTIDRRGALRFSTDMASTLRGRDGRPLDVIIADFSRTGFRFFVEEEIVFPAGTLVSIGLSAAGSRPARVLRADGSGAYGCEFLTPLDDADLRLAFRSRQSVVADLEERLVLGRGPAPTEADIPDPDACCDAVPAAAERPAPGVGESRWQRLRDWWCRRPF